MVELNRSVAVAEAEGPAAGLTLLDRLSGELAGSHLYHAARAELLTRLGRIREAASAYRRALEHAGTAAERRFLGQRLQSVTPGMASGPFGPDLRLRDDTDRWRRMMTARDVAPDRRQPAGPLFAGLAARADQAHGQQADHDHDNGQAGDPLELPTSTATGVLGLTSSRGVPGRAVIR